MQNDFFHKTKEGQIKIGQGYYYNKGGIDQQYNDFGIFNFGKGVPVNAGILCIWGQARVDPETGSQYLLKNGEPVKGKDGEFLKPEQTISSEEYWENYFKENPELKPNKIIYGNFYTSAGKENSDLIEWAETKKAWNQDDKKKKEFEDYQESTRQVLRKIFTEVVKEIIDSA